MKEDDGRIHQGHRVGGTRNSRRRARPLFAVVVAVAGAAVTVAAHHAFSAEFDVNKPVTLVGAITRIEWVNPHAFLYIDVKDDQGTVTNWAVELGPPNTLLRAGWTRSSLTIGDQLTVSGYTSKDGTKRANARAVQLPDGRNVFAGTSVEDYPK